jgi:hypothetical protein
VRRLLIGGSPDQGQYPASEVNDGTCPEKPVHLSFHEFDDVVIGLVFIAINILGALTYPSSAPQSAILK